MPLYEYQCKKCKHRFEKIQKVSDPPVRKCPQCGGPTEKLIHAPAVQFKGTGWYVTDYAGKKSGDGSSSEKSDDKKSSSAGDKSSSAGEKSESKPKKTESKKSKES